MQAIKYYEQAIKTKNVDPLLINDLASLYLKMDMLVEAEKVISEALDHDKNDEVAALSQDANLYLLLAKVLRATGSYDRAAETLCKSKEIMLQYFNYFLSPVFSTEIPNLWKKRISSV